MSACRLLLGLVPLVLPLGCHWLLPMTGPSDNGDLRLAADLVAPDHSRDGGPPFGAVEPVPELNSAQWENDPVLTADGHTIYFSSTRDTTKPSFVGNCIYRATRIGTDDEGFQAPVLLEQISSPAADFFAVTADDTIAVLTSERQGNLNLWLGTRTNLGEPWNFANFALIDELNTDEMEWDARLSNDGLRLYYAPTKSKLQHLVVARRPALDQLFAQPVDLLGSHAASGADDADPALSADEKLLIFTSRRPGGKGLTDLWYTTRTDLSKPFEAPQPLVDLNTPSEDRDPFITVDGRWLYFTSTRTPTGQQDIYRTRILVRP